MRCVLDAGLYILAGRGAKLMTLLILYSLFCPSRCQRGYLLKPGFVFWIMLWRKGRWPSHVVGSCYTISVERGCGSWSGSLENLQKIKTQPRWAAQGDAIPLSQDTCAYNTMGSHRREETGIPWFTCCSNSSAFPVLFLVVLWGLSSSGPSFPEGKKW